MHSSLKQKMNTRAEIAIKILSEWDWKKHTKSYGMGHFWGFGEGFQGGRAKKKSGKNTKCEKQASHKVILPTGTQISQTRILGRYKATGSHRASNSYFMSSNILKLFCVFELKLLKTHELKLQILFSKTRVQILLKVRLEIIN